MQPLHPAEGPFLRSLVNAGLLLLDGRTTLSHVAYLHLPEGGEPELFQLRPRLDAIEPASLFRLYNLLGQAGQGTDEHGTVTFDGSELRFLRTKGAQSVGVHLFGTAGQPFSAEALTDLHELAAMSATVIHQFQQGAPAPDFVPDIRIETTPTGIRATAESHADGDDRNGIAEAETVEIATAQAVLDAYNQRHQVAEVQVVEIGTNRIGMVILIDADNGLRMGVVIGSEDPAVVVAGATVRAIG